MQSREHIARDFAEQREAAHQPPRKRGRTKMASAAQSSMIFEAQVQIRAAKRLISRILDEAGYSGGKTSRAQYLLTNWRDRGRIDIQRPNGAVQKRREAERRAEAVR